MNLLDALVSIFRTNIIHGDHIFWVVILDIREVAKLSFDDIFITQLVGHLYISLSVQPLFKWQRAKSF